MATMKQGMQTSRVRPSQVAHNSQTTQDRDAAIGRPWDTKAMKAASAASQNARSIEKTDDETDEVLVDRVRDGDRAAFDEIYRRYFKRIYGFLDKRLRNRSDTEETTQEVFINIFSSIGTFRGEAPFAAWAFGLTRRTLAARFRRKQHPTVPLFDDEDENGVSNVPICASTDPTPLESYEMVERAARLKHTLNCDVSAEQRQLFELHHLQSMPIAEIAAALSKSEDSIKSNLYRTRKLLLAR